MTDTPKPSETAGDLLSNDGCPECEASVVRMSSEVSEPDEINGDPSVYEEYECRNGHVWVEDVSDEIARVRRAYLEE